MAIVPLALSGHNHVIFVCDHERNVKIKRFNPKDSNREDAGWQAIIFGNTEDDGNCDVIVTRICQPVKLS